MKNLILLLTLILVGCSTADKFFSSASDSSRDIDSKYTQDHITSKIDFQELDQNLTRYYSSQNSPHVSIIPLTGALIDSIGFLKSTKDDYNKYEFRKISDGYKAFLFNKTSCFYVFLRDSQDFLKDYDILVSNTGSTEQKATVKSDQNHDEILKILNEIFSKTYSPGTPRSIKTTSVFETNIVCSDKIDFKIPFSVKVKSSTNDKVLIDLFWL